MKLLVKNLGLIQEGTIELNGVTVIAGKNNTGKSTLGKILYCLGRTFERVEETILHERQEQVFGLFTKVLDKASKDGTLRISMSERWELGNDVIKHYYETGNVSVPENIRQLTKNSMSDDEIIDHLKKILGIKTEAILEKMFDQCLEIEIGKTNPINNPERNTEVILEMEGNRIEISRHSDQKTSIVEYSSLGKKVLLLDDPYVVNGVSPRNLLIDPNDYSHQAIIEKALLRGKGKQSVIDQILGENSWNDIVSLMNSMCDGELVFDSYQPKYATKAYREALGMNMLSAGIKSILTLKTLLVNGTISNSEVLVLDEPEVLLHPDWQFKLAEILVLLPKTIGTKVFLSTHSTDFLSAVNYYTQKYNMENVTRYYQTQMIDGYAKVKDVTEELDVIYADLGASFLEVSNEL